jgi:hypothetical protein
MELHSHLMLYAALAMVSLVYFAVLASKSFSFTRWPLLAMVLLGVLGVEGAYYFIYTSV